MVRAMGDVPVQVGGGIRTQQIIEAYLEAGVQGLILGTKAVEEPAFHKPWHASMPAKLFWIGCPRWCGGY